MISDHRVTYLPYVIVLIESLDKLLQWCQVAQNCNSGKWWPGSSNAEQKLQRKVKRNAKRIPCLILNVTALFQTTLQQTYEPVQNANAQITDRRFVLGAKTSKQNRKTYNQEQQLPMKIEGQISRPGQYLHVCLAVMSTRRGDLIVSSILVYWAIGEVN